MNTEELTQVVTAHQNTIFRHDGYESRLDRIETILQRVAEQQERNTQTIANLATQQELSRQDINQLTANIEGLRNQVATYIAGREQQ